MEKVLEVRNLHTHFVLDEGTVTAVNGVDLDVYRGKTLGIVGESGCGKSVTAQSIMRIIPSPPGQIVDGSIKLIRNGDTIDLASYKSNSRELREIRGREISMIFQEPMTSMSPVHTVGAQIMEVIRLHQGLEKADAKKRAVEMLKVVGIPRPELVVDAYPHQLSGGMRQRAMIGRALSCEPKILIADEPTTALDVTVQAQILKVLADLRNDFGMALILITHNLGVVAQVADYVAVFYLGIIVEEGPVEKLFARPLHPYTSALFESIPKIETVGRLSPIRGSVPDPFAVIHGCPFRDRCEKSFPRCETDEVPPQYTVEPEHRVRCFLYEGQGNVDE